MSVVVQEVYAPGAVPVTQQVGPRPSCSATAWRILTILGAKAGSITLTCGSGPFMYTIMDAVAFADECLLPSADFPFPITMGNTVVTCTITADSAVRIVYEDNIG